MKKKLDKDGLVLSVTSGKGGVGKTYISSMLAYAFASTGLSVLVIDMDTGLRNMDIVLGIENDVIYNLYDVLEHGIAFEDAVIRADFDDRDENVPYVLVSDQQKTKNAISNEKFKAFLEERKQEFDIIILDTPAGIEYGFKIAAENCDKSVIVCTPERPIIRSAEQIVTRFEELGIEPDLIINEIYPKLMELQGAMTIEDIAAEIGIEPIGLIPLDMGIRGCANIGFPVWYAKKSSSRAAICVTAQAFLDKYFKDADVPAVKKFTGEEVEIMTPGVNTVPADNTPEKPKSLFGRVKRFIFGD